MLYTWAGPEIAVATTKAYSTQLVLMDLVGLYLADVLGTVESAEYSAIVEELAVRRKNWKSAGACGGYPVFCLPLFQS